MGELSLQHAVLVEQVDAADVGDRRNDHRRDRAQRGLFLERAREQRAGADELLQARLGALGARARLALGIEQEFALGFVLPAQRGGGDERVGHRLDLDHVGLGAAHRLAATERQRRVAQLRDRAGDVARAAPRGDAADAERQQDAAAVGERRVAQRPRPDRRRNAERDRPSDGLHGHDRGVDLVALDRRRPPDAFAVRLETHHLQQARRRRSAEEALLIARARDAQVLVVEHRDDPVLRNALLADDAQDRLGTDDRRQHVTQLAVALDRNPNRNPEAARACPSSTSRPRVGACARPRRSFPDGQVDTQPRRAAVRS